MTGLKVLALSLLFSQLAFAQPSGYMQSEAEQSICEVLSNIQYLLVVLTVGVSGFLFAALLIVAVLLHMTLKEDTEQNRMLKLASKALLVLVPAGAFVVIFAVYFATWVFQGGQC